MPRSTTKLQVAKFLIRDFAMTASKGLAEVREGDATSLTKLAVKLSAVGTNSFNRKLPNPRPFHSLLVQADGSLIQKLNGEHIVIVDVAGVDSPQLEKHVLALERRTPGSVGVPTGAISSSNVGVQVCPALP